MHADDVHYYQTNKRDDDARSHVFNEMNKRFATFPFTLRALEDEKQARMGVVECLNHELVHPYPVRTRG